MNAMAATKCASCGAPLTGIFCAQCGEKSVSPHDFTVKHYVEESIEGITHLDNRLFRSLRLLITRPGALTINFAEGRRMRFMRPIQLFIISNLLFFLSAGKSNVFSMKLGNFLGRQWLRRFFESIVGPHPDMARLRDVFLEKMSSQSKAFIFLFIPFFAFYSALVFIRRGRPLGLHFIFATHYFSFLLFFFTLFGMLIETPYYRFATAGVEVFDRFALWFNLTAITLYFCIAARSFFAVKWWKAVLSGMGAGFLFLLLLEGYRIFLFYNIVRNLH